MKKLVIVLLLGLLIAGSVFAQWAYGYNPAAQTPQLLTGTLQIVNGMLAIVGYGYQVYYVPNLQPYYGVNGMYVNSAVSVYGNLFSNNYCEPFSFLVNGAWYNLPRYNYYYAPYCYAPPSQSIYVPYQPIVYPSWYGWYGWYGWW